MILSRIAEQGNIMIGCPGDSRFASQEYLANVHWILRFVFVCFFEMLLPACFMHVGAAMTTLDNMSPSFFFTYRAVHERPPICWNQFAYLKRNSVIQLSRPVSES